MGWYKQITLAAILLAVLVGGVFLFLLRTPQPVTRHRGSVRSITSVEESVMHDEPLLAPFYPTFDDVKKLDSLDALEDYLYAIDESAYVYYEDLAVEPLLTYTFHSQLTEGTEPKVLIFHTHSQEAYIDSRPGERADTIVGMGDMLAEILAAKGVAVVHDIGQYDVVDGVEHRDGSYQRMEPAIKQILAKYPSIVVTIDLHRDGVPDDVHLVTAIDGQSVARIMFFNGISRLNHNNTPIELVELPNPYLRENLALSLRLQLTVNTRYPGFARKIYIRGYRYSLHLTPKSMLIELGANTNTVAEARNALRPLAEILIDVLG